MIHKPTTIRLNAMTTGIAAIFAMLLLLPTRSALAAGDVRPMIHPAPSRVAPTGARVSRTVHADPRIAQFNRELAAYKQTVAALRRDSQRLMAQQRRLDALVKDIGSGAQMDMINLQSLMSNRQTAVQLSTNLIQALSDSADAIAHNIGK